MAVKFITVDKRMLTALLKTAVGLPTADRRSMLNYWKPYGTEVLNPR